MYALSSCIRCTGKPQEPLQKVTGGLCGGTQKEPARRMVRSSRHADSRKVPLQKPSCNDCFLPARTATMQTQCLVFSRLYFSVLYLYLYWRFSSGSVLVQFFGCMALLPAYLFPCSVLYSGKCSRQKRFYCGKKLYTCAAFWLNGKT